MFFFPNYFQSIIVYEFMREYFRVRILNPFWTMAPKGSKLNNYINYRMRVTLQDGRNFIGTFKGSRQRRGNTYLTLLFSIWQAYEFNFGRLRRIQKNKTKKRLLTKSFFNFNFIFFSGETQVREEKRTLGLVLLRGEHLVSMSVDGPPPQVNPLYVLL